MHFSVWSIYCPKNENYDFVLILRKKKCGNRRQLPFFGKIKHMYFEWVSNRPRIEVWGCGFLNLCTSIFWESNWPRIISAILHPSFITLYWIRGYCTDLRILIEVKAWGQFQSYYFGFLLVFLTPSQCLSHVHFCV